MGLDSVEILIEVEKTFDIKIPDQEAEKIITVADFHNSVWQHLAGRHSDRCQTQTIFYRVQRSLVESFQQSRHSISRNSSLDLILPVNNRRQVYNQLSQAMKLELPPLVLTKPWMLLLNTFGVTAIIGGLLLAFILTKIYNYSYWLYLLPFVSIYLTYLFSQILNPKRTVVKQQNLVEFVRSILAINYKSLTKDYGTNRKEVEDVINQILADRIGLDLKEIQPDKKIADDLGVD